MDETQKNSVAIGIFFSILMLIAALIFLPLVQLVISDKTTIFWIGRIAIWFCLLLIYLYVSEIEKSKFLLYEEQNFSVSQYLISFFKIIGAIIIGAIIIGLTLKSLGFVQEKNVKLLEITKILKNNFPLLIFTCITAGATEELIFRGYLMPRLQLFFKNNYASIAISSVLFGLMHIGFGTIFQVLGPMMIGFVFAVHYQRFRNIKILIFCHFFWDFMSLMASTHLK